MKEGISTKTMIS